MKTIFFLLLALACRAQQIGTVEKWDPDLDLVLLSGKLPEIIAEGYTWTEGPLWIGDRLLFSDVPANAIYQWSAQKGASLYLKPSGFTGEKSFSREPGSNGLLLDLQGNLILCQHGDRQLARMDAPLDAPKPVFIPLAGRYQGKRLSSPNDAAIASSGAIFFTDPPYGLPMQNDQDPSKELKGNGVYLIQPDGTLLLLTDTLTRPNGIALFPDEKRLLVANSDPAKPNWYVYDIEGGQLANGRIFYSRRERVPGLPDGLKIDRNGYVFTSGPGGIIILNAEGKALGRLRLDEPVSNCALSDDQKTLYITNNKRILRWEMR